MIAAFVVCIGVGCNLFVDDRSKAKETMSQMLLIGKAIGRRFDELGGLPENGDAAVIVKRLGLPQKYATDRWRNGMKYRIGKDCVWIISFGADKRPGLKEEDTCRIVVNGPPRTVRYINYDNDIVMRADRQRVVFESDYVLREEKEK
jgi:hypothetical protein